jgi:hypothetical protein
MKKLIAFVGLQAAVRGFPISIGNICFTRGALPESLAKNQTNLFSNPPEHFRELGPANVGEEQ